MTEENKMPQDEHEHESRKRERKPITRKVLVIVLAVVIVVVGGGIAVINHYLNRMEKINNETQTTLSPEEFMSLIGFDTTEEAASSLEKDTEQETEATSAATEAVTS